MEPLESIRVLERKPMKTDKVIKRLEKMLQDERNAHAQLQPNALHQDVIQQLQSVLEYLQN